MSRLNEAFRVKSIKRAKTELWNKFQTHVPAEQTMMLFDKNDAMNILLQEKVKERQSIVLEEEVKEKEAELNQIYCQERKEELRDIPKNLLDEWDQIVSENDNLRKGMESGTLDERTLRYVFKIKKEDAVKCGWVDSFLISREKGGTFIRPAMSPWDDLLELFGLPPALNACAPVYWKNEVIKGRGERARLIKVGIDIPAIWTIDDAEQLITADLYMTFSWKVKALRKDIWDDVARKFTQPVWKVRMRNGKLISNLREHSILDDETTCGDEKDGFTNILQRITITADFSQSFDLHRFPFDEQKIEFILRYWLIPYRSKKGAKRGRLIFYEDIEWQCRVKDNALKPKDEWFHYHPESDQQAEYDKLEIKSDVTCETMDPKRGRRWPELRFSFQIRRNPEFMKWNVACPITMIVLFGLVGNVTAFQSDFDRTSFTAALLFTVFSIKGNVQYALSKVGYRTTLDSYILWSQAVIIIQGVVGVFFSHLSQNDEGENLVDFLLPIGFGCAGLLFWVILTYRFWRGKVLFPWEKKKI